MSVHHLETQNDLIALIDNVHVDFYAYEFKPNSKYPMDVEVEIKDNRFKLKEI